MTSTDRRQSAESLAHSLPESPVSQHAYMQHESRVFRRPTYDSRRGSTASSISGVGGVLDVSRPRDSIAESGQNAISTLLQPPIIRSGLLPHTIPATGYKPPSSRDIPPVALTNISHVDSESFRPYISQFGTLYDVLQRARENEHEGDSELLQRNKQTLKGADFDTALVSQLERRQSEAWSPRSTVSSIDYFSWQKRKSISNRGRGPATTPLSTIPKIYFDEHFRLENPRIFDIVSERSEVVRSPSKPIDLNEGGTNAASEESHSTGRKALATNAILQEKLSWYLDTVEIHLISSISTASTSFFTALGSLRDLHSEAAMSVQQLQSLRNDFAKLDNDMALGGLKIANLRRRRENVRKLADAIAQLGEVIASVSKCEEMVERGNIEDAMDVLDDVERLIAGESSMRSCEDVAADASGRRGKLIDLRGIKALESASDDLGQLRYRIGLGYEHRFLDGLLGDLRRHVGTVPPDVTLIRLGSAFQRSRRGHRAAASVVPSFMHVDNRMRSRLEAELGGLGRARHIMPAATSFKNAVLREMKAMIRRHLPSSSDDDDESIMSASTHGGRQRSQQEKSSILARNLRAMDADDSYTMLTRIYTGISELMRRLSVQVKVLLDITVGLGGPHNTAGVNSLSKSPNPQNLGNVSRPGTSNAAVPEDILQVLDMSSLLEQAVDIVQAQMVKILKVRSEQTALLSLEQFLRYFSLNRLFVDECEAISGRNGAELKTVVDNQIKDFISSFGDAQKHRIVQVMDSDRWDAKDFGDYENTLLSRILEGSTKDAYVWSATSRIWQSDEDHREPPSDGNSSLLNGHGSLGPGKDKVRSAVVDEQKYILPESAMLILRIIEGFQHLMIGIPSMVQDITLNFLECLKLFNSRCSQLILGAGATRSAGLKNITTKHLSLALQALSFITALIPYIREFIRRHCSSASLMADFDKVKRLYQEHQSGIHEKLVDIMSSRAAVHVNSMKRIDWDEEGDVSAINPYMETLTKETGTLQRVLSKHLPEATVMIIMNPVFSSYRDQWTKAFQGVTLKTERGRQRLISDVEFFKARIDKLDGAGDLGDHLIGVVKAKSIAPVSQTNSTLASPDRDLSPSPNPTEANGGRDHGTQG